MGMTPDTLERDAHLAIAEGDYRQGVRLLLQAADGAATTAAKRALLAQAASVHAVVQWADDRPTRDEDAERG